MSTLVICSSLACQRCPESLATNRQALKGLAEASQSLVVAGQSVKRHISMCRTLKPVWAARCSVQRNARVIVCEPMRPAGTWRPALHRGIKRRRRDPFAAYVNTIVFAQNHHVYVDHVGTCCRVPARAALEQIR